MKFCIFGLTISSSWGNGHATPYRAIVRALKRQGHEVTFYERDVPYYAARRDFSHSPDFRLVLYDEWENIRAQALEEAAASDVTINASYCPSGADIIDAVLEQPGPLHVFYDLDTPITLFELAQNSNLEYLRRYQVSEFDLVLSFTGGQSLKELTDLWHAKRVAPLYGCVDPDVHTRVPKREEFDCDLSYMGTYAADRQHKLDNLFLVPAQRLPMAGFVLAGSLYPWQWTWPANVRRFEHVSPHDHPAFYSSSRLTLNITRDGMARSGYCPSGRFFEAAACGTPIVSDWFAGLDSFFTPEEEIILVESADDVEDAIDASETELKRIASRARERTLTEHTGNVRARQLVEYCEAARGKRTPATAA